MSVAMRTALCVPTDDPDPDSQPYERAMGFLGVAPGRTVVFEDSPTGIASARAAGTYVIGFRGGSIVQDTSAADESIDSFEGFSL